MCRCVIEFERLDMGERPGGLEPGNGGNCCVRSDVDENALARQHAPTAIIEMHLQRFRRHKAPVAHDQLRAGRFVVVQMRGDFAFDHVALALHNGRHVDGDGTCDHAEPGTLTRQVRDLRVQISFLLGRQAMLGQDPPIQRRSMTAVRRPDCAICQANNLPLLPLPRTRMSNCSGCDMVFLAELPGLQRES